MWDSKEGSGQSTNTFFFSYGDSTRFRDVSFPDEAWWSHSLDTPHSVGPSWTSDQLDAETSTWQHTAITRDKHTWLWRNLNLQSQQPSGRRPTLETAPRCHLKNTEQYIIGSKLIVCYIYWLIIIKINMYEYIFFVKLNRLIYSVFFIITNQTH